MNFERVMVRRLNSKTLLGLLALIGALSIVIGVVWYSSVDATGYTRTVGFGGYPSINSAVQASAAGDTIVVQAGVYYEQVTLKSGITIEAAPGAAVAVDGSEASLVSAGWQNYSGDVYYANVSWAVYYVAQDDLRLFRYGGLSGLLPGGYFNDTGAGRVYVRLSDGTSPSLHQMHVARRDAAFLWAGADNVTLRGLESRYCNGEACLELTGGADNNLIESNVVHGAKFGIVVGDGQSSLPRSGTGNTIRSSTVYETGYKAAGWSWDAVKATQQEGAGIFLNGTGAATLENNTVRSGFDGIDVHYSDNAVLSGNTVSDCTDDGLEMDIANGSYDRAWGNTVYNCYVAVSASPVEVGPLYVYRNQLINNTLAAFKVGWDTNSSIGAVYFYHNSVYTTVPGSNGITDYGGHLGSNIFFRNNAIFVPRYAIEQSGLGISLDADNLAPPPGSKYTIWQGVEYSTLNSFQGGTGQETHGIEGLTGFVAPPLDLHLLATSANIDRGVVLPGFNDNFCGAAPDIGAFEYCPTAPAWPSSPTPTPNWSASSTPPPSASATTVPTPTPAPTLAAGGTPAVVSTPRGNRYGWWKIK